MVYTKFDDDRLWNEKSLSTNNNTTKKKNNNNNIHSAWRPVSGSKITATFDDCRSVGSWMSLDVGL